MINHIIIVGAGFTGLYAAFLLLNFDVKITILEKRSVCGGKIRTQFDHNHLPYEFGPSIFHTLQPHMMNVVKKLKIEFKKLQKKNVKTFPGIQSVAQGVNVGKIIDITQMSDGNEICEMEYRTWKKSYNVEKKAQKCIFPLGWQNTIDLLVSKIMDSGKVRFFFDVDVLKIESSNNIDVNIFSTTKNFTANHVIICTSFEHQPTIESKEINPYFKIANKLGKSIPTLRVYIEFKNELPKEFPNDIFDASSHFRWCLKMNDHVLLVSYTDGKEALKRFHVNQEQFIKQCLTELNLLTMKIRTYHFADWEHAFTILIGCKVISSTTKKNMHKITQNVSQTFLPDPQNQSWVEGHLSQAFKCVNEIEKEISKSEKK